MTTIAAFVDGGGKVAIAADRQFSGHVTHNCQPKIRRFGYLVAGFSGPSVVYSFEGKAGGYPASEAGCAQFAADFRQFFVDKGHVKVGDSGTNNAPGYALVVWPGAIRLVDFDGGILVPDHYSAIGSGLEVAFGAFHVARAMGVTGRWAVEAALAAAVAHDPWTGGSVSVWVEASEPSRVENVEVLVAQIRARGDEEQKRRTVALVSASTQDTLGGDLGRAVGVHAAARHPRVREADPPVPGVRDPVAPVEPRGDGRRRPWSLVHARQARTMLRQRPDGRPDRAVAVTSEDWAGMLCLRVCLRSRGSCSWSWASPSFADPDPRDLSALLLVATPDALHTERGKALSSRPG